MSCAEAGLIPRVPTNNKIRKINNNLNKIVTEEVAWYKSCIRYNNRQL